MKPSAATAGYDDAAKRLLLIFIFYEVFVGGIVFLAFCLLGFIVTIIFWLDGQKAPDDAKVGACGTWIFLLGPGASFVVLWLYISVFGTTQDSFFNIIGGLLAIGVYWYGMSIFCKSEEDK